MSDSILLWNEILKDTRIRPPKGVTGAYDARTAFDNDYSRIVNSSAMRRLQDKAQVFPLKKGDFVRSRLTHSLEVSHLGHSMGLGIHKKVKENDEMTDQNDYGKISGILATAGLIHDFGNPPFGHFGETAITDFFQNFFEKRGWKDEMDNVVFNLNNNAISKLEEGTIESESLHILNKEEIFDLISYDGNAQTLRILSKLQYLNDPYSYNLTFPTLACILKYPKGSSTIKNLGDGSIIYKRNNKFGYFLTEKEIYEKIQNELKLNNKRYPLTYILEASDDISYSVADLEDGVKKGIINSKWIQDKFEYYEETIKETLSSKKDTIKIIEQYFLDVNFKELGYRKGIKIVREKIKENHELSFDVEAWLKLKESIYLLKYYKDEHNYKNLDDVKLQYFRIFVQRTMVTESLNTFISNYDKIMTLSYSDGDKEKNILENSKAKYLREATKKIAKKIFNSREVVEAEILGYKALQFILNELVNVVLSEKRKEKGSIESKIYNLISSNYIFINRLVPYRDDYIKKFNPGISDVNDYKHIHVYDRLRMVIDFVSGMTDSYALDLYKKIACL